MNKKLCYEMFIKNKVTFYIYTFFLILICIIQTNSLSFFNVDMIASFSQLRVTLSWSIFYLIFFFFIAYEYCHKVIANITTEKNTYYLYHLLVFFIFDLILTLICSAFNIGAFLSLDIQNHEFICHILINLLINVFGISLLGILMGFSFSQIFKRRLIAYPIFSLFVLLSSFLFEDAVELIYNDFLIDLYPIYNIFNIYSPSLDWMPNFLFGYSVLPYRIALLSAWILFFSFILSLKICHSKISKSIISVVCVILCVFNIIIYVQPSSKNIMNFSPTEGLSSDFWYYYNVEQKKEKEDFEVLSYKLDIHITNKLNVIAELEVNENLNEYRFTLYHGYKVNNIYDYNGNDMSFVQENDYLTVANTSNTKKLYIKYCGSSSKFYSNFQGTVLPGFFPFYPHPGYKYVFNVDEQSFDKLILGNEAEFEVNITGVNNHIFSNLNKQGDNKFTGKSTSVTIISGFVDSFDVNGKEIIYPYLDTYALTLPAIEQNVNEFCNEYSNSNQFKKIIVMPNINLGNMKTVIYDDYITTVSLYELSELCVEAEINPRKQYLNQLIILYLNNKDIYESILKDETAKYGEKDLTVILMGKAINKLGENEFIQVANAYLHDDSDEREILEFLEEIN